MDFKLVKGETTAATAATTNHTTTTIGTTPDPVLQWNFFFFELTRPGATILIGAISIVHSLFHLPHWLLYRRLGILTAFWSLIGVGLVFGAVVENELLYDVWIWYSCVYVPTMLCTMALVLTAAIWALDLKLLRAIFAALAILFYLFMFYCIVFVTLEKNKIFTTPAPTTTTTTTCQTCPNCTTKTCPTTHNTTTTRTTTKETTKKGSRRRFLEDFF